MQAPALGHGQSGDPRGSLLFLSNHSLQPSQCVALGGVGPRNYTCRTQVELPGHPWAGMLVSGSSASPALLRVPTEVNGH